MTAVGLSAYGSGKSDAGRVIGMRAEGERRAAATRLESTMSSDGRPPGFVPYQTVQASVPDPETVQVSDAVALETVHVGGPSPTLVFVHGGLGCLWNPYPQLYGLSGECQLVTYSLAGNGNSTERPEQTVEGHVEDLEGLLAELEVDSPIVHGHSYGSAVAIEYAKRNPVSGLAIHAGGDHGLTPQWEKPFVRLAVALRLYRLPTPRRVVAPVLDRAMFHRETPPSVVRDFLESNPVPGRRSAWRTVTRAFWGYDGRQGVDAIDAPTLVVHGSGDLVVPFEVARATANRLPRSVVCRLERAGHVAMVERPATYNRLLRALLAAVREGQSLERSVRHHRNGER